MTVARSVSDVLDEHVTLEVECIDRMYLNVYQPRLQHVNGVVWFLRGHRGATFASSALMDPISKAFVAAIDRFCRERDVPMVDVRQGSAQGRRRARVPGRTSAARGRGAVRRARRRRRRRVFRTEKRRNAGHRARATRGSCARPRWSTSSTSTASIADFGPFFIKFCSYFPVQRQAVHQRQRVGQTPGRQGRHRVRRAGQRLRRRVRTRRRSAADL